MWDRKAAAVTKVRAAHRGNVSIGPADADPDLLLDVSAARIADLAIGHGDLPVTVSGVTGGHIRTLTFIGEPSALTVLRTPEPTPEPLPRITLRLPRT
ncbi:hypothetical protein, partial [Catenulispora rubra]|uniref:hypothetical protein n=1 Tax=Catenulispora rubra TaxID=280293 RepID=UPI0018920DFE